MLLFIVSRKRQNAEAVGQRKEEIMITNNFIKMCEQAEEIQGEWKPKVGDKYYSIEKLDIFIVIKKIRRYYLDKIYDKVWLPTLEQLFEKHAKWYRKRYKSKIELSIHLLYLGEFAEIEYFDYKYHSLQEIALGYLYQEKYNKIWNGKKWEMI